MRIEPCPKKVQRGGGPLWRFLELGTIRQYFIHCAGIFRRPQGRLTLRIQASDALRKDMAIYLDGLGHDDYRQAA